MGLDINSVRFPIGCKNAGTRFNVMKMGPVLVRSQTLWNRKNFRPVKKP